MKLILPYTGSASLPGSQFGSGLGGASTRTRRRAALGLLFGLAFLVAGCEQAPDVAGLPRLAVTSSYLEAAVRDLLPAGVEIVRLAEPGTCPGHFDLRPSQAAELRRCRALLRFDFQKGLDDKVGSGVNGPRVAAISVPGGMGVPGSYRAACEQTADVLVELGLLTRPEAEASLTALEARLAALGQEVREQINHAGLRGTPVVTSRHQGAFCAWLGLEVVATFRGADVAAVGEIDQAIRAGREARVPWVIANRPEGRRTADALAERLGARVVVFDNFPQSQPGRPAFDEMVRANVRALLDAVRS